MPTDESYRAKLQQTIASIKAWTGFVADVARIEESDQATSWRLTMTPRTPRACAIAIVLRGDQQYDLVIGGETYANRPITSLDRILPLLEAIAEGRVVTRSLESSLTGMPVGTSTVVTDASGRVLADLHRGQQADTIMADAVEIRDTHYLPYRRPNGKA